MAQSVARVHVCLWIWDLGVLGWSLPPPRRALSSAGRLIVPLPLLLLALALLQLDKS